MARVRYTGPAEVTKKQKEVVSLVSRGMSNKEVARVLGVAPDTVKTHLRAIYTKFGIKSRAQVHTLEGEDVKPPLIDKAIQLCEQNFRVSPKNKTEEALRNFALEIWELLTRRDKP